MLIHVVGVEQPGFLKRGQQIFRERLVERLGFAALGDALQARGVCGFPFRKQFRGGFIVGGKFRVAEDGGFDFADGHSELGVAGTTCLLEQCGAHAGDDLPVAFERVNIAVRHAAAQVAVNILQILRLGAVNVAREVEIEVVLHVADLRQRNHLGVAGNFSEAREGVHDLVDVLGAEAVLWAVFDERLGGINHKDALAGVGIFLVEHDDAGRDTRAVKEIRRQADDALDVTAPDDLAPDVGLGITAKEHAVRQNNRAFAVALERGEDVEQKSVIAILLRRDAEGKTVVKVIGRIEAVAPSLGGERRIGDGEIEGLERAGPGVLEMRRGKRVVLPDFRRGTVVQDHVHPRQRLGGVVHFLPVNRQVQAGRPLGFVVRLEQQRTRTAGGIVNRLARAGGAADADDLGQDARDFRRGVELALALARLRGEVAHEIFVGVT